MAFVVGAGLAVAVLVFCRAIGFERERSLFPVMLIVVASYYDLFAVIGGSTQALGSELLGSLAFVALAAVGFKRNLWLVAAGLVGHGLFDFVHAELIDDRGVPSSWPTFCATFDIIAGVYLAWRLWQKSGANLAEPPIGRVDRRPSSPASVA